MSVQYLEDHFIGYTVEISPPKSLPRRRADGYGSKIVTSYMVNFKAPKAKRRVYATCWSNVASYWILHNGGKYHLQSWDFDKSNDASALERGLEAQAEASIS